MQTLLVTVIGPHKKCDLEVPGDIPISDLLPFLLDICGSNRSSTVNSETSTWCLRLAQKTTALSPARSLIDAGVLDGAVLHLQDLSSLKKLQQPQKAFTARSITPGPGTGGIGVRWDKEDL